MKIIEKLAHPSNYRDGRMLPIKFIVIHYVGATGSAANNAAYFQGKDRGASAHYFVGHANENADIFRSVRDENTAWHVGASKYVHPTCRNDNAIGIEMCCRKNSKGNWYFDDMTVTAAIALTRELMAKYDIPPDRVIRHYDVTGKVCPEPYVRDAAAWAAFKAAISTTTKDEKQEDVDMTLERFKQLYAQMMAEKHGDNPSDWAKAACEKAKAKGVFKGDGHGNYEWQDPVAREELAGVLDRVGLLG